LPIYVTRHPSRQSAIGNRQCIMCRTLSEDS
jgi:hypothetical protein